MKEKLLLGDILHDYDRYDKRIKEISKENIVLYIRVYIIVLFRYKREGKDNKYQHISRVRLIYTDIYKVHRERKIKGNTIRRK